MLLFTLLPFPQGTVACYMRSGKWLPLFRKTHWLHLQGRNACMLSILFQGSESKFIATNPLVVSFSSRNTCINRFRNLFSFTLSIYFLQLYWSFYGMNSVRSLLKISSLCICNTRNLACIILRVVQ